MRQITKRQLDRQGSKAKLLEWLPFQLVVDGEVVAAVIPVTDGSQPVKAKHSGSQATELRLSKKKQALGRLSQANWF